jgi:ribosome-binding protein aMBF1 (putative translation factor)
VLVEMLIKARENMGLSQRQLSAQLERPVNFVFKVEAAERELNVIELMGYLKILEVDFVEFTTSLSREIEKIQMSK